METVTDGSPLCFPSGRQFCLKDQPDSPQGEFF